MRSNDGYGLGKRRYRSDVNKAITNINLDKVADSHVRDSLALQQEFGLRREESIKFVPHFADNGSHIQLKSSWTKGGIERVVPVTKDSQRQLLNELKNRYSNAQSLIPKEKNYIQQRHRYDNEVKRLGLKKPHGLRHAYAQQRYQELTNKMDHAGGWQAPIAGGKSRHEMTKEERVVDMRARMIISSELGHSRIAITKIYLG